MKALTKTLMSFLLILAMSCGDPDKTADEAVSEGWDAFESGNLEQAIKGFDEAIELDNTTIEAYVGKAFAYALLGSVNLAKQAAEDGLDINENNVDLLAALGLLDNALGNYTASNTSIDDALSQNSAWTFGRGLGLSAQDLHVTQAQNYFSLQNYSAALASMQEVNSNFNPDVNTTDGLALLLSEIENFNRAITFE